MSVKGVIYPGTFDPITNGHLDIIERCAALFNPVVVAVGRNPEKKTLFSLEERIQLATEACAKFPRTVVKSFDGLLVPFAMGQGIRLIVKGLRFVSDFEYEFQMALMNRHLESRIETVFMVAREDYTYLSSSSIKQVALFGGDVGRLVPPNVKDALLARYGSSGT